jgi:hypothetical protein
VERLEEEWDRLTRGSSDEFLGVNLLEARDLALRCAESGLGGIGGALDGTGGILNPNVLGEMGHDSPGTAYLSSSRGWGDGNFVLLGDEEGLRSSVLGRWTMMLVDDWSLEDLDPRLKNPFERTGADTVETCRRLPRDIPGLECRLLN